MSIIEAIKAIEQFQGDSLTSSLSKIESSIIGLKDTDLHAFCANQKIDNSFMASAASIKKMAGQINVIIHAAGILCSLPSILETNEIVQGISLGAGNTGRKFDLETNFRIAEFKFIDWQGGAETIRQNAIFKDFFELAEHETTKHKYLYVVGTNYPMNFLKSGRSISSVLSRQPDIHRRLTEKYGNGVSKVRDYYELMKNEVQVCDVSSYIGRII